MKINFNHPKQVDTQIFLFPEGVRNGNVVPMNTGIPKKVYDSQNQQALELEFSVPKPYRSSVTSRSDVVFALRLKVDESQRLYFPYPLGNQTSRYLGARIKLVDFGGGIFMSDLHQNKDVLIAPLDQLKSSKIW